MQGLKASQQDLQAYRPEAMQARLNLLSSASAPYQGMNNALETLWGAPPSAAPQGMDILRGGMGPSPQRMLGHDLPQQPQYIGSSPNYGGPQGNDIVGKGVGMVSTLLDPLNMFGGR
jgi:hypothetical protein